MDEMIRKQDVIEAMNLWLYDRRDKRTVDEVINALSSVQTEPLTSCEQAIDYLHETGWLQNHDRILTESKIVSPVQPEHIKGHWIEITLRNHTYKCSVCGRLLVNITDGKNNVANNYPYCHCGADMRGNKNGTD